MNEIVPEAIRHPAIRTEMVEANGLNFEVDKCGNSDKLAICLHGFPEHSFSWRYQLPFLAELGYEAWAPNLRGYGGSDKPQGIENYTMQHLLADVAGLIDQADKKEVVLIAHDWGAVIAWQFAMQQVRALSHLIICNVPHPGPMDKAFRKGFAQLKKSWYIFFFQIPWLPEYLFGRDNSHAMGDAILNSCCDANMFPEEVLAVYRRNANQPGALTAMINYYRAAVRRRAGFADQPFNVIEVPTLMIWGEDDIALTKDSTLGTEEYVRDFSIRYLPRVSHWVQQEAPEATNQMIGAFLTSAPVPEMSWEMKLTL